MPLVTPATTLLILLGASNWPRFPEFHPSPAFANSAAGIRAYFVAPDIFGLPGENLLDLFDSDASADDLDVAVATFLEEAAPRATDLLVYYVGHGDFADQYDELYLAVRRTRQENPRASSIHVQSLAATLREKARNLRRYLIFDCCYAAAFRAFQARGGPGQIATKITFEAFSVPGRPTVHEEDSAFLREGTALLCSSRHKTPSLLAPDERYTMFSEALVEVLRQGDAAMPQRRTLADISDAIRGYLLTKYGEHAPRPELHSPNQRFGDIAAVPLFINTAHPHWQQSADDDIQGDRPAAASPDERQRNTREVAQGSQTTDVSIGRISPNITLEFQFLHRLGGYSGAMYSAPWSPDGRTLASASIDKTVRLWGAAGQP